MKLVNKPITFKIVLPNNGTIKINARSKTNKIDSNNDLTSLLTPILFFILNTVFEAVIIVLHPFVITNKLKNIVNISLVDAPVLKTGLTKSIIVLGTTSIKVLFIKAAFIFKRDNI
jgi:hypothetical protein